MRADPTTPATAEAEQVAQAARLRQLLRWIVVICFVTAPIDLLLALLTGISVLFVAIPIVVAMGCVGLLGLALVRRGLLRTAALTVGAAILAVAVVGTLILPTTVVGMAAMPIMIVALLLPYLPQSMTVVVGVIGTLAAVAIFLLGTLVPPLLTQPPRVVAIGLGVNAVGLICATTLLLLGQYSRRIEASIAQLYATNTALQQARDDLENQVAARTADLQAALAEVQAQAEAQARLLAENSQQREVIREMSVPVLPVSSEALVIPLVGALDTARLRTVQEQALGAIQASSVRYMLLDITGVPIVDTQVAHGLIGVVQAARLLGVEVVLVGVRPEVAQTVVTLGLDLHDIATQQSLQEGIAYTMRSARRDHRKN